MKLNKTDIDGVFLIEPPVFEDGRGYFFESFNSRSAAEAGVPCNFVQDNESFSKKGTIRELHF